MTNTTWITGDSIEYMESMDSKSVDFVIADPPYSNFPLVNKSIEQSLRVSKGSVLYFMYAEDIYDLDIRPEQVLFWVKPISTKNTSRRYSRFVEVICVFRNVGFTNALHWSNRSGIFTDSLVEDRIHPFKKPESLIQRLILQHSNIGDLVLDPFAGSGTVQSVCARVERKCISIELEPSWAKAT